METIENPRVVVVTGGSAGVGRATVREFARRGASVGIIARGEDGLRKTKDEVENFGVNAVTVSADVSDPEAVEAAADVIEQKLGPIDVWINNAMTTVFAPFHEIEPADYKRATEVTYLGTVYGTMSALKRMRARNRGTIVQVGSALSYRSIPLQTPYCGAKHAIRGFTDSLRCELMHDKINVHLTMVQLPAHNTPQFNWCKSDLPQHPQPVPPIFQPEIAADAIYFAATHKRREIFVSAMVQAVIAGQKIAPAVADWYLAKTGYDSQQSDTIKSKPRPFNLYDPVPGDHSAHGIFDDKAKSFSWGWWLNANREMVGALGLLLLAGVGAKAITSNSRSKGFLS